LPSGPRRTFPRHHAFHRPCARTEAVRSPRSPLAAPPFAPYRRCPCCPLGTAPVAVRAPLSARHRVQEEAWSPTRRLTAPIKAPHGPHPLAEPPPAPRALLPRRQGRPQPSCPLRASPQPVRLPSPPHASTDGARVAGQLASAADSPGHGVQRSPPLGCAVRARRWRPCPNRTRESSPRGPRAIPRPRPAGPGRRNLAGPLPAGARGPHCEVCDISGVFCAK
jgi:hypothetical protein